MLRKTPSQGPCAFRILEAGKNIPRVSRDVLGSCSVNRAVIVLHQEVDLKGHRDSPWSIDPVRSSPGKN